MRARFGGGTAITLSPLGDRVATVTGVLASAGKRLGAQAAASFGTDFIIDNAGALGIDDAIDDLVLRATPRRDTAGWQLDGSIYRTVAGYTLSAHLALAVDDAGAIERVEIGEDLLPVFAVCDAPSLDPAGARIRSKLVGTRLTYEDTAGRIHEAGAVTARDLATPPTTRIVRTDNDVQRAYVVHVQRDKLAWAVLVDGETGAVIRVDEQSRVLDL